MCNRFFVNIILFICIVQVYVQQLVCRIFFTGLDFSLDLFYTCVSGIDRGVCWKFCFDGIFVLEVVVCMCQFWVYKVRKWFLKFCKEKIRDLFLSLFYVCSWFLVAVVKFLSVSKKNIFRRWWRKNEVLSKKGSKNFK